MTAKINWKSAYRRFSRGQFGQKIQSVASLGLVSAGAATEGVTPTFFLKKNWRPFHLFCSSLSLLLISLGCHLLEGVTPQLFYLSDIVCPLFFEICPQKFFSFGCHPSGGCHPGRSAPPLVTPLNFRYKWSSPTNHSSCQKTRWMDLLYGVRILAVDYFILPQSPCLTDGRTNRQKCDRNTVRNCVHLRSHTVKMCARPKLPTKVSRWHQSAGRVGIS